ncbi:MAG: 2-octaprenyl-6-methoxyphenyl hydroxylase [Ectothiorhodospiraceae bacterium]
MADYDVVIAGGGLVGASLACALDGTGVRAAVIEPVAPGAAAQPSFDDRQTALAPTTRRFFEALGLWRSLSREAAAIREIHVSERGGFGFVRLHASDEGLEALGYVVPNRALGAALQPALAAADGVDCFCPAQVDGVEADADGVVVSLTGDEVTERLRARLLVVADGARSATREALGIGLQERPYGQSAVIANVTPERHHAGRAFERFTRDGPLALLPGTQGRCAVVWTVSSDDADSVAGLDDRAFLAGLQQRFGYRLGRFLQVGKRGVYPLAALTAERFTDRRVAVIGNAAHTLHPVAGQGFNLAVRDVAVLAELVAEAVAASADPGAQALLDRYQKLRSGDYRRTMGFTDTLVRVFSNDLPGLRSLRNAGLLALDLMPVGKHALLRQAMGRAGWLPRLARGVPLTPAAGGDA